jgi:hypothetical protein
MPGSRTDEETDPSLNHPLTMSYMGAGSGWEKRPGRRDFHPPLPGGGSRPAGARGGAYLRPPRQTDRRLRSHRGQDAPDQHRRNRPAGAGEEADAEPDADLIEVDGGWHVGSSRCSRASPWSRGSLRVARIERW